MVTTLALTLIQLCLSLFPFLPFSSHFPPATHYHFHAPHPQCPPPSFSSHPQYRVQAVIPYIGKKVSTGDRIVSVSYIVATEHADSSDRPADKQSRNQRDRSILLLITFLLLLHLHRPSHSPSSLLSPIIRKKKERVKKEPRKAVDPHSLTLSLAR